jgi:hypothetical protein
VLAQAGFQRVVGDVTPEILEMLGAADEVIEALLVPETA